jgi:phage-related protein
MARAEAQYMRIFDSAGTTYFRWQSYYVGSTVTWSSQSWEYHPFSANGLVSGQTGGASSLQVSMPATAEAVQAIEAALTNVRLVEIKQYSFDPTEGNATPQAGQTLMASFIGEVVGASGGLTQLDFELGSILAPIGAQVPPRKYTSILIGAPCRL